MIKSVVYAEDALEMTTAMIIFLHIPKTAGSTFHFILENNFGASYCHSDHTKRERFTPQDLAFAKKIFPNLQIVAGHNLIAPLSLGASDAFHMTFLREPVSRVISQYQEQFLIHQKNGRPTMEFEQALRHDPSLENAHVKLMAGERSLEKAKRYLEKCNFIGLTEKFDLSLRVFEKIFPRKLDLHYPKLRVQPNNTIRKRIEADLRAMEMAREVNQLDIQLYSFAANEIFPKLCEKAGVKISETTDSLNVLKKRQSLNCFVSRFYNHVIFRSLNKLRQ